MLELSDDVTCDEISCATWTSDLALRSSRYLSLLHPLTHCKQIDLTCSLPSLLVISHDLTSASVLAPARSLRSFPTLLDSTPP